MKAISDKSLSDFFEFHRARIRDEDIRDNCPGGQGYGNYVQLLDGIRESGRIPDDDDPYLWDLVYSWPISRDFPQPPASKEHHRESMARYRNFVSSIVLGTIDTVGSCVEWNWSGPVSRLIEDADREDQAYLHLLRSALETSREKLADTEPFYEPDRLFFAFGMFLANGWLKDGPRMGEAARRLIREEGEIRTLWCRGGPSFFWDLQDLTKEREVAFKKLAAEIQNPANDFDVECLLRSL